MKFALSDTPKTGFLATRPICNSPVYSPQVLSSLEWCKEMAGRGHYYVVSFAPELTEVRGLSVMQVSWNHWPDSAGLSVHSHDYSSMMTY